MEFGSACGNGHVLGEKLKLLNRLTIGQEPANQPSCSYNAVKHEKCNSAEQVAVAHGKRLEYEIIVTVGSASFFSCFSEKEKKKKKKSFAS